MEEEYKEPTPSYIAYQRVIRLNTKSKFKEFLKAYPYKLEEQKAEADNKVYTRYLDWGLDDNEQFNTIAYSIEPKDKPTSKNQRYKKIR